MRRGLFAVALLVLGYLYIGYTSGAPLRCGTDHGCEAVRASEYAAFLGWPTPLYGLVFYLLLALLALGATPVTAAWLKLPLAIHTGLGLVVSLWLTYLEAFVVELGVYGVWSAPYSP